jgi:large subunit ribosomal protein L21
MYAIIENSGRQYRVAPGQIVKVERLLQESGADITLDKVLMVNKDGKNIYGSPFIQGAKVLASVGGTGKGRKVIVHKQRPRKVYRKTNGHRQQYTALTIKEIVLEA